MEFTEEDVRDLLALLDSLPYNEVDLRTSRFRLTLRRSPSGAAPGGGDWTQSMEVLTRPNILPVASRPAAQAVADTSPELAVEAASSASTDGLVGARDVAGATAADAPADAADLVAVRAPLPGTFYRSPQPGAAPFVEVGSVVEPDTVVGIVETMKLMNSVHAGVHGWVVDIHVADGGFAAQDAVLLRIRPVTAGVDAGRGDAGTPPGDAQ